MWWINCHEKHGAKVIGNMGIDRNALLIENFNYYLLTTERSSKKNK